MNKERAILAGGCFWGMEELLRHLTGVIETTVGYTGGNVPNPTYELMKSHDTGHAEAIEVIFDNEIISYRKLLEFFFQIHDATQANGQGNDIGSAYRSAIFYLSDDQKQIAKQLINEMTASGKWLKPIATEVTEASEFYKAEDYHQDYLQRYPDGYSCHFIRPNWKL